MQFRATAARLDKVVSGTPSTEESHLCLLQTFLGESEPPVLLYTLPWRADVITAIQDRQRALLSQAAASLGRRCKRVGEGSSFVAKDEKSRFEGTPPRLLVLEIRDLDRTSHEDLATHVVARAFRVARRALTNTFDLLSGSTPPTAEDCHRAAVDFLSSQVTVSALEIDAVAQFHL